MSTQTIRVAAVHLGGVRALAAGQAGLELRFSEVGLHILDLETRSAVGRLEWAEIRSLALPRRRWSLRRAPVRLVITTDGGQARFALTGLTRAQVKENLAPLALGRFRSD
ncbi:MAG: hypothetical protein M3016_07685 [Actinomycetota bacterium]|nr:hypothetical protein [Actinomycetota bacterium]